MGQIPESQSSWIGNVFEIEVRVDTVDDCRNSVKDAFKIEMADLRKITVINNPTTKSGNFDWVIATRPAAINTLEFAIMSLREHTHVECMFKSSVRCFDNKSRHPPFAIRATILIRNMKFDSGIPPAKNLYPL